MRPKNDRAGVKMNKPTLFQLLVAKVLEQLNSRSSVRDAYHSHGSSFRGLNPSNKGVGGATPFESGLGRQALRLFELAPEVVFIVSEPFTMEYFLDEKVYRYTPDYLLHLRDGRRVVVEVKYRKAANSEFNRRRFAAIREILEAAEVIFAVLTEESLCSPILQRNMSLVERHNHLDVPAVALGQILGHLRHGSIRLGLLVDLIGCRATVMATIAQGHITTDFRSAELTDNSLMRRV